MEELVFSPMAMIAECETCIIGVVTIERIIFQLCVDAEGCAKLWHVKEIVQAHNGRASARAANGKFILRVNL